MGMQVPACHLRGEGTFVLESGTFFNQAIGSAAIRKTGRLSALVSYG